MRRFVTLVVTLLVGVLCTPTPGTAGQQPPADGNQLLPLTAFSPTLLGMYRKVMEVEGEIKAFSDQYGLDLDLARSVVLHESGGNGRVVSIDGANGYFQMMPATTSGIVHGRSMMIRKIRLPHRASFRKRASESPRAKWKATLLATNKSVLKNEVQNKGSFIARI